MESMAAVYWHMQGVMGHDRHANALVLLAATSFIIGLQTPSPQPYQRAIVAGQIITVSPCHMPSSKLA